MRHLKAGRALGVKPAHRRAIMRNAVTSILEHEQIRTTLAKAKELRKPLDEMITLGKRGDLNARRQALAFVESKAGMKKLFGELAERYKERKGGYSRILPLGPRRGDGAPLAIMMLVDSPGDPFSGAKKPKRKAPARGKKPTLDQVAEQVQESKRAGAPPAREEAQTKA
jgi:large subunit ribosomal protein L17